MTGANPRTLLGLALAAAATLVASQAIFAAPAAKRVTVTATDTGFRLSVKTAPAGKVTFAVKNTGKKQHSFKIGAKKTAVLSPKKSATLVVTFAKPGKYAYSSTVRGDTAKGFKGTFTIMKAPAPPGGNLAAGKRVFTATGCGACHVFKAAGTNGTIGPNLDTSKVSRAIIVSRVTNGKGTMPAYKGQLTSTQIQDVADFVLGSRAG
jgi:mono/diheme cytochrome c family protein